MSFKHPAESSLPYPYNRFVEPGSQLELDLLFQDDSEDMDSLWESEPTHEESEKQEYIKSLLRSGAG